MHKIYLVAAVLAAVAAAIILFNGDYERAMNKAIISVLFYYLYETKSNNLKAKKNECSSNTSI